MRAEAMDCDVEASQASSSSTDDRAIEGASEPQEAAATVATTPTEVEQGGAEATLPVESVASPSEEGALSKGEAPKVRRSHSKSSKRSVGESGGDTDTDDELQWCSHGIAVFQNSEEEGEEDEPRAAESMEVDQSNKSESDCPEKQQRHRESMLACFKQKESQSPVQSHLSPVAPLRNHDSTKVPFSQSALGASKPLQPVTLASTSTPPPSIPHTYTPTSDVDMDTGEGGAVFKKFDFSDEKLKALQAIKKEESKDDVASLRSPTGCVFGRSPFYAHNPFTLMGSLPMFVKTEPGLSPSPMSHACSSPLVGQTFFPRVTTPCRMVDYVSPIASLPPMEALHSMQLQDLIRMKFPPMGSLKPDPNRQIPSFHPTAASPPFYQKPELISKLSSSTSVAKLFKCQQCGATFKHRHHVVRHMRAHTGEKPFRCDECGAMFARKCILTNHIRTHTGEKPYVCGECGDAFSRKHHLVIHRRTHTGEKPYVCSICATAFARSHHLNRHLKTHILMQGGHMMAAGEGAIDLSFHKMADLSPTMDLQAPKALIGENKPQDISPITDFTNCIQVSGSETTKT